MNDLPYLMPDEQKRAKMLVSEIQDALDAIKNELSNDRAYRGYLQEKMRTLEVDIPVLRHTVDYQSPYGIGE